MEEQRMVLFPISCLDYEKVTNFKIIWLWYERMLPSEGKHISACCGLKKGDNKCPYPGCFSRELTPESLVGRSVVSCHHSREQYYMEQCSRPFHHALLLSASFQQCIEMEWQRWEPQLFLIKLKGEPQVQFVQKGKSYFRLINSYL